MDLPRPDPTFLTPDFAQRIAAQIVEAAGELIVPRLRHPVGSIDIREKAGGELVSEVDLLMQDRLAEILGAALPESSLLSEEGPDPRAEFERNKGAEALWIVDPLDGTSAFLSGKPTFGVAVALCQRCTPVAGWLYAPIEERLTYGSVAGGGWWHRSWGGGEPNARRDQRPRGVIASGDFSSGYRARVEALAERAFDSRGTSSCVIDYLDLLSGGVDFLLYRRTQPWDHAAGVLLAGVAGGRAVRFDHGGFDLNNWNSGLLVVRDVALSPALGPLLPSKDEHDALQVGDAG
jgi:fructose-1,6-bisphosphatase/inositol monophosphatase family enzyme